MNKKLTTRFMSLLMSVIMVITIMPTFVLFTEDTADAEDVPSSPYWSILASTDFTGTAWTKSDNENYYTSTSPNTSAGGAQMGWNLRYGTHSTNEVNKDTNGVGFPWVSDNNKYQGFLYLSSFNGQTTNTIFNGINNFKIDLTFRFTGTAKCNTGYNLDGARNDVPLIKLAKDSGNKYNFRSQYNHQSNWFLQTAWGERSIDDDDYYCDGGTTETEGTTTGGKWAITTQDNNANSVIQTNVDYHYVVYYADKMLGCYVTDDEGNVVINYNPVEMGSYNLTPDQISSIYLGASEFNWAGKYDIENISYKSIEIYKGVNTSTYDNSRNKYLYAYFTGNDANGETLHYAISGDGVNFEPVSAGSKVWNPANFNVSAIETYPSTDSSPGTDGVAISEHVRDSYAFIGQDGKDYVIATDLNTNNGSWSTVQNSRFLVWKMDNFADVTDTKPWSIDTSRLPGMDAITGNNQIKKAWAPQVIWDPDMGKYMLYWAVGADGIATQIYYTYTSDLKSDFTTVKRLLYPDFDGAGITNHIDADITYLNGLYYCYFKNEDSSGTGSKRIWYSVSPYANGPYTDFELIDTSYQAEGPQVYETSEGSYILMVDGYGDGTYHMYSAATPYDFNSNYGGSLSDKEVSTNVTSLSPRHGSIVRITTDEYNRLDRLTIGEEVRYQWETDGNYAMNTNQTDSTGNPYHVTWNPSDSTTTTGNGVLSITDSGIYLDNSDVTAKFHSGIYTATFTYKSNSSTARDVNHSIFSISKSNAVENYVRLSANGAFYVNGNIVTPSGNISDGSMTRAEKFAAAVADTENFHRYTITSDGLITSLIIDGEYICGIFYNEQIQSDLWITFGWARMSDYENNRLSAQFGPISISNVTTDTGHQDEMYNTLKPSDVNVGTFNTPVYHRKDDGSSPVQTEWYSNIVYSSVTSTTGDTVFSDERTSDHLRYKFAVPGTLVGVYDGVTSPSIPVVFESYMASPKTEEYIHYAQPYANSDDSWNARKVEYVYQWTGYGENYKVWPSTFTTSDSFSSVAAKQYSHSNFNDGRGKDNNHADAIGANGKSGHQNNTNTHRFWKNSLRYYVANANFGDNYYELIENPNMEVCNTSAENRFMIGWSNRYYYYTQLAVPTKFYVINYKPIYDILKSNSTSYVKVDGAASSINIASLFANDANNRWMYTKDSYEQALYAMKLLKAADPNNFDYSTPTTGLANYKAALEKAIEEFNKINLVKNTFNITYRMANGTTKTEIVTAGSNLAKVPANTADYHIFDTETHKKNCTWTSRTFDDVPSGASSYNPPVTPTTNVMPKSNTIFVETGTIEACNHTEKQDHVDATASLNGYYDYACSVCGEIYESNREWDPTVWTAYNSAVEESTIISGMDNVYTSTSLANYAQDVLEETNGVHQEDQDYIDRTPQTFIDGKVTAILNLSNDVADPVHAGDLDFIDFDYDVNVYVNGEKDNEASSSTTGSYQRVAGSAVNVTPTTVTPQYTGSGNVYRWVINHTVGEATTTQTINTKTKSMTVALHQDSEYNIYVRTDDATPPDDGKEYSKVTVYNKSGQVADVGFIENGEYSVTFDGTYIAFGSTAIMTVGTSGYYDADSITINDVTINAGSSGTVTLSGDTFVNVSYSPTASSNFTVILRDGSHFKGSASTSCDAMWDTKLSVTADDIPATTLWKLNDKPYAYGTGFDFRVTGNSEITMDTTKESQAAIAEVNYLDYGNKSPMTFTIVANYYVPDGAVITNAGLIYKVNTKQTTIPTSGITKATIISSGTARNLTANLTDTKQINYHITRTKDTAVAFGVVAYVDYSIDGVAQERVYSDEMYTWAHNPV